jgi:hypothetical protein
MAAEKKSYPKIPRNNWFLLREKFKQRTPERVSPSYVATALGMSEASASANIIPPLRTFGLIAEDNKPTDLAYDWRDDNKYAAVCEKIFEKAYPQELRDIFHDPQNIDSKAIENWFARDAKVGQSAARAYGATFVMLLEADVSKAREQKASKPKNGNDKPPPTKQPAQKKPSPPATKTAPPQPSSQATDDDRGGTTGGKSAFSPKLHVDIQIHISPDSSPEQIDKIFESMAKHLPFKG